MVAVAAVAVAALLLGRTGGPFCDPDGVVQLHGLWHLASATLLAIWWRVAFWLPHAAPAADRTASSATASTGRSNVDV